MIYDLIKHKVSIVSVIGAKVELKKRGGDYIGICPFHAEKTPSFSVNEIKKFFYCFGCQAGGDVIGFVAQITGMSYRDAGLKRAKDFNIDLPKTLDAKSELDEFEKIHSTLEVALDFYRLSLPDAAVKYLNNRGISAQIIEKFQIGYAPSAGSLRKYMDSKRVSLVMLDKAGLLAKSGSGVYEVFRERIIFPIRDNYNKLIAFGGRALADIQPKYLNSPETLVFKKNQSFYGQNFAYNSCYKSNKAILVEGYIDLIKMHAAGFDYTMATLGTAINIKHLEKLWAVVDEIIMCLDGDEAGVRASKKVVDIAISNINANKLISFVIMPKNLDPDDVIITKGSTYMRWLIENRQGVAQMIWSIETKGRNFHNPETIAKLEAKLMSYLEKINDNLVVKSYKRFFNDKIWSLNRGKKTKIPHSSFGGIKAIEIKNDLIEITLLGILIICPDIFDDAEILKQINKINFSLRYNSFVTKDKIMHLSGEILPIIQKSNPSFESAIAMSDAKKVFLKILNQKELMDLKTQYEDLVRGDPKKTQEFYSSYKSEIDRLLSDNE
jgi:DNA primase